MCISILLILFISEKILPFIIFVLGLGVVSFGPWFGELPGDMANHSTVVSLIFTVIGGATTILCEYQPIRIIVDMCRLLAVSLFVVHQQKKRLCNILRVVVIYSRSIPYYDRSDPHIRDI